MTLRDGLLKILEGYLAAKKQPFTGNAMANFMRQDLPAILKTKLTGHDQFIVDGSAGQGNWANGPWVAVFNQLITTTAQTGYYPVYLFREDMKGVYLSLNQAMTEAKKHYKSKPKQALEARAAHYRAMVGNDAMRSFPLQKRIDLAHSGTAAPTAFYESGNICAKYYDRASMPQDEELSADFMNMLVLYEKLVAAEGLTSTMALADGNEPEFIEDASKVIIHTRIERNQRLVSAVKKALGYKCQICGLQFDTRYGELGKGYIEAHHLKPISELKDTCVSMDPMKDFAVLCANCHRMIHRSNSIGDIAEFKKLHLTGH